jgi:hypothetical protein
MSSQAYRDSLREAGRKLAAERKRERFAESLASDNSLRYVWTKPVRCPVCRGTEHKTERTERHDGVKSQRKTCRCGHKFILLFED